MTDTLKRINELAARAKSEGLTQEETEERERLRKLYLEGFRKNMIAQLENTYIVDENGVKHKLRGGGK